MAVRPGRGVAKVDTGWPGMVGLARLVPVVVIGPLLKRVALKLEGTADTGTFAAPCE